MFGRNHIGTILFPNTEDGTEREIAQFNKQVCNDKRVEVLMLPIRDGVTLAWKF